MDIIFNYFLFNLWTYLNNIDNARHVPALFLVRESNYEILNTLIICWITPGYPGIENPYSRNSDFSQMRNQNFLNTEIEVLD